MSLNVYLTRNEVPDNITIIDKNDIYFNGYTNLGTSEFETNVLETVDEAKRVSDFKFNGRTENMGNLNKSCLSTGTKTLLNIYNNPDDCFNVDECGSNALEFLCDLRSGTILWEFPFINITVMMSPVIFNAEVDILTILLILWISIGVMRMLKIDEPINPN